MSKKRFVTSQNLQDKKSQLGYWDWLAKNGKLDSEGNFMEPARANPDIMEYKTEMSMADKCRELFHRAARTLDGRKAVVYQRCVKEGATTREVANELNVTHQMISVYLRRAYEQVARFCKVNEHKLEE